jgi:hypothetical protein
MNKRTRLFLAIASGILVVGLGTGLVAAYVGGFQGLTIIGSDGPAELAYVPADARFVAYADVRDVMDSEVRRKLSLMQPETNAGPEHFKEQTGIDLTTDVDYVVAASAMGGSQAVENAPPLVIARGRFDAVRIEGLIREQGGTVEDYNGSRLLLHDEHKVAVVFLEPGLVAMGGADMVRRAIDTKASGSDVKGNTEVMNLVRQMEDGDAWMVARFDALSGARLPAEVANQLPPINWFSAKGFIGSGLEGQLRVETRDEASAQNLQEVIRGFMAMGRLQTGQHPEIAEFLNSVQLGGDGKTVSLSFSLPSEMIDALGALRAERARPRPDPAPAPVPRSEAAPAL